MVKTKYHTSKKNSPVILYANCWEDADILLKALNPGGNDIILSIGSAGDNSFSLLSKNPKRVMVYDICLPQLHLIDLKKSAFENLDYEDFLSFLGFSECPTRIQDFYNKIISTLSPLAQEFWTNNISKIERGVIHTGKLESYFSIYRRFILPFVASKKDIQFFFAGPKNEKELANYKAKLSKPFLFLLLRAFFSKPVLKAIGRDPAFFREVKGGISNYLFEKISAFILNPNSYKNHYMHYISTGHFGNTLPHYARRENFNVIKANLHKLSLRHDNLKTGLKEEKGITLINASDIFEYLPVEVFQAFGEQIHRQCPELKRIVYWNFLVERILSRECPTLFKHHEELSNTLSNLDKLFFYARLIIETNIKKNE